MRLAAAALLADHAPADKTIATLEGCSRLDDAERKNGCLVVLSSAYGARERWKEASDALAAVRGELTGDEDVVARRALYFFLLGHDKAGMTILERGKAELAVLWLDIDAGRIDEKSIEHIRQLAKAGKPTGAASVAFGLNAHLDDYSDLERSAWVAFSHDDTGEGGPSNWYVVGRIAEILGYPEQARAAYQRAATGTAMTHHLARKKLETLPPPTR
jgi:hypothetical protein